MDILGVSGFILSIIVGLLILVVLVALHEFGHGIVARRNGVRVKEFGIGFPPRAKAWKVKKSVLGTDVLYSLNWLPLGGFVQLQGENDAADKKGDYGAASFWVKTKILFAGVFVNWVTAAILLSLVALVGMPKIMDGQFTVAGDTVVDKQPVVAVTVTDGLPAALAGIKTGDKLLSVAGQELEDATKLIDITRENHGKTIPVVYERNGQQTNVDVTLRADNDDKKGYLGLAGGQSVKYRSTWSAPVVGVALTGQFTAYTFESLGKTLANFGIGLFEKISLDGSTREKGGAKLAEAGNNVGGPVALLGMLFPAAQKDGPGTLLLVTALVSLTLAVMNALPIPALDGGRWFVTFLYRKVFRKELVKEKEESIHGTGMMILLGLFVLITISDVTKFL